MSLTGLDTRLVRITSAFLSIAFSHWCWGENAEINCGDTVACATGCGCTCFADQGSRRLHFVNTRPVGRRRLGQIGSVELHGHGKRLETASFMPIREK